jgi:hypothetical protein
MVVFLGIRVVMIPPAVSMPNERGATSMRTHALTVSFPSPFKMAAWTAAP